MSTSGPSTSTSWACTSRASAPNDGDDGTDQRLRSAARLARWLQHELGDEPDAILLGDWNARPAEPEWQPLRDAEIEGQLRFLAWNKDHEASHFFQNGKGSRLDLVVVSDDAERAAVDKGARVIPWRDAFASLPKLRGYIATLSDHMPVVSRFYFPDAAGD
jgi:endonuclease/exonuclease/phosphatase family metal-dependent hydrolase